MFRGQDSEVSVETVRYGRARLTVARSAPPRDLEGLAELVDAYSRGEARATSVAAAFLHQRVVDHSPSFDWRSAKLRQLIPIVCALSEDPKLEASTPTELADALMRARVAVQPASAPKRRLPVKLIPRSWRGRIATGRPAAGA